MRPAVGPDSRLGDPLKVSQSSRILQSKALALQRPLTIAAAFEADSLVTRRQRSRQILPDHSGEPNRLGTSLSKLRCARLFLQIRNKKKPGRNGRAFDFRKQPTRVFRKKCDQNTRKLFSG
jgi:hypothetical protein